MMPYPEPLWQSAILDQATPMGVQLGEGMSELEAMQEQHLADVCRQQVRRADHRQRRREIRALPVKVALIGNTQSPGTPLFGPDGVFTNWANR